MKRWTADEREFVRLAVADLHTASSIGHTLGRTARSVRGEARRIGIDLRRRRSEHMIKIFLDPDHFQRLQEVASYVAMSPTHTARMIVVSTLRDDYLRDIVVRP